MEEGEAGRLGEGKCSVLPTRRKRRLLEINMCLKLKQGKKEGNIKNMACKHL